MPLSLSSASATSSPESAVEEAAPVALHVASTGSAPARAPLTVLLIELGLIRNQPMPVGLDEEDEGCRWLAGSGAAVPPPGPEVGGKSRPTDDQVRALDGLAHAHYALHDRKEARRHWRRALHMLAELGIDRTDDEEANPTAIRSRLDDIDQQRDAR